MELMRQSSIFRVNREKSLLKMGKIVDHKLGHKLLAAVKHAVWQRKESTTNSLDGSKVDLESLS